MRKKLLLFFISCIVSVFITACLLELYYRIKHPNETFHTMTQYKWMSTGNYEDYFKKAYVIDPEFGFRPILDSELTNKFGTSHNNYSSKKRPGIRRLLFVGDSVTASGFIIKGLRKLYGDDAYEYWNAGVGSYNTAQEVNYYKKYNFEIQPDEVILTFVYNDFDVTPIAFFNSKNLVVYSPNIELHNISPYLFKNSYIYRRYISFLMTRRNYTIEDNTEVENSLKDLRDNLIANNIKFTVIISPLLKPSESFTDYDKKLHSKIVTILTKLNIRFFDITNTSIVDESIQNQIPLSETIENDFIHPSLEVGELIAKHLFDNGIFNQ